jgi:hypothetical protein
MVAAKDPPGLPGIIIIPPFLKFFQVDGPKSSALIFVSCAPLPAGLPD